MIKTDDFSTIDVIIAKLILINQELRNYINQDSSLKYNISKKELADLNKRMDKINEYYNKLLDRVPLRR